MTKKKSLFILIIVIVLSFLIIAGIVAYLYVNTDMLKSNKTLFLKYVGKNAENMQSTFASIGTTELDLLLEQNKYTSSTTIKVNNTENIGTSSESTENDINKLEIVVDGQTDKANQYLYRNIKLDKEDESLFTLDYIEEENLQGIRFSDLFRQYLTRENANSNELLELYSNITFTEEEKQSIKEKYLKNIIEEIQTEKFSKQSDVTITINEKNVYTNIYTLTLTKEELNSIYIKLLENLKQDEIILQKIDAIGENLNQYTEMNLKEQFISSIEQIIDEINRNNIGQDETKIIVYENQKNVVRTMVQTPEYEISLDWLQIDDEKYAGINVKDGDIEYTINLRNQAGLLSLTIEDKESEISYIRKNKIQNEDINRNITIKYEDDKNRVEASIVQNFEIVEEFEEIETIDSSINFDELNQEQENHIMNQVNEALIKKMNTISEQINTQDLLKVLQNVGILQEGTIIESEGITETEKSRYNSQYEMLVGENLEGSRILNLIDATKENMNGMEVVSNTELKLEIDRNNSDEEVVKTLKGFFEKNKNKKYNVDIEYDENGLVNYIIIEIVTD